MSIFRTLGHYFTLGIVDKSPYRINGESFRDEKAQSAFAKLKASGAFRRQLFDDNITLEDARTIFDQSLTRDVDQTRGLVTHPDDDVVTIEDYNITNQLLIQDDKYKLSTEEYLGLAIEIQNKFGWSFLIDKNSFK